MTPAARYGFAAWIALVGAATVRGWYSALMLVGVLLALIAALIALLYAAVRKQSAPQDLMGELAKMLEPKDRPGVGDLTVTGSAHQVGSEAPAAESRPPADVSRAPGRWTAPPIDERERG